VSAEAEPARSQRQTLTDLSPRVAQTRIVCRDPASKPVRAWVRGKEFLLSAERLPC
jgi:hypothetical protein